MAVVTPRRCLPGLWGPAVLAAPVASAAVASVADLEDATAASGVEAAPAALAAALEVVTASVDVAVAAVSAADVTADVASAPQLVAAVSPLRLVPPAAPVVALAAVTVTVIVEVTGTAIATAAGTVLAAVGTVVGVMAVAHMMTDLAAVVSAAANATLGRLAATWSPSDLENPAPQGNPETVGITVAVAATTTGPEITTTPGNAGTTADTKTPGSCVAIRHDAVANRTTLTDQINTNMTGPVCLVVGIIKPPLTTALKFLLSILPFSFDDKGKPRCFTSRAGHYVATAVFCQLSTTRIVGRYRFFRQPFIQKRM